MLFTIIITILLTTMKISHTDGLKTTSPVSIVLNGFTLQTWTEKSLWNTTRLAIVHHLNEFCTKDYHCDAEYGIGNIHLINANQYGSTSIQLNITADEPVLPSTMKFGNLSPSYNYTALLTGALFQAKFDIERVFDNRSLYPSTHFHPNSVPPNQASRLLFVFLGIALVALIFGSTVLFFQRIRRHSYSKLLKPDRPGPPIRDELLTNSPSISTSHQ